MKSLALVVSFLAPFVATGVARAAEPVVTESGNEVVVSMAGLHAASDTITARGDQLVVELAPGAESIARRFNFDDATIKRVEVASDTLIVTVHHSRESTLLTAQQSHLEMAGDKLRLVMPRSPRKGAPVAVVAKPEAKIEPKAEPKAESITVAAKAPAVETKPVTAAKPEAKNDAKPDTTKATTAPAVKDDNSMPLADVTAPPTSSRGLWWMAGLGLVALGGWYASRKKRGAAPADEQLKVVASRSLGGKSRLVLVEAKGQKLLISVDERGTRLISQVGNDGNDSNSDGRNDGNDKTFGDALGLSRYSANDREIDDDRNDDHDDEHEETDLAPPRPMMKSLGKSAPKSSSPAVAGLLKLRNSNGSDSRKTNDDRAWLADLAAATSKRMGRQ